ncbi:MAG: DUF1553 domain-containing protein, partial [Planctomycetales bacterium]|nr:DUF1553 domain-containing protein [Planctomycetales bacterium]
EMPPEAELSPQDLQALKDWLSNGADWPDEPLNHLALSSDSRAGYDWWALQPLATSSLRYLPDREAEHPIDHFVDQRLSAAGLRRSPPAEPKVLLRRAYVGLHGLPPTPEQIDAFAADAGSDAFPRLVDQLLSQKEYGQRWARHWLDIARFGESQGFERDKLRTNSWRFRDWVVDALNSDMPYDQFARKQLAGDVLYPGDASALIATGFLVAAPYDEVGKNQQSAAMREVVRQDELEDLVGTVAQSFLGLTANCARCHDHKFDPILQREYYQIAAALAGVHHGEPSLPQAPQEIQLKELQTKYQARALELGQRLAEIEEAAKQQILADRRRLSLNSVTIKKPEPIARWDFEQDSHDTIGKLHAQLREKAVVQGGRLRLNGQGYAVTEPLTCDIGAKTLEAWVKLDAADQAGGSVVSIESADGVVFDGIVYAEQEAKRWMAGSDYFSRTQSFGGPEERDAQSRFVHLAITYNEDGLIAAYRDGKPYGTPYVSSSLARFQAGQSRLLFGLRHSPSSSDRMLRCEIAQVQLYDRALSAAEVAASAGEQFEHVSESEIVDWLDEGSRIVREQLRFELDQLVEHQRRLVDDQVYAVLPEAPHVVNVLLRGDPATPGEQVQPGGIASIHGVAAEFNLPENASDGDRRTRLAHWITDQNNALFARVIANRLWHYHFGVGLVETPNDFGFNGGRPSHPQLLDWLAAELIRNNWSLKHLHRCIMNSATYQQSSQFELHASQIDYGNRLLWRKSPQRLDAETLRDALLQFAERLDCSLGGPGYYDFTTFVHNSQFYEMRDAVGETFERRALYRTWVRSARSNFLDVFDCPDPSVKAPDRAVTTTPLQALSLLNNSFVLRMADALGERAKLASPDSVHDQIRFIYREVLGRLPDADELRDTAQFVEAANLAALCRVVFNSNEFLYVD